MTPTRHAIRRVGATVVTIAVVIGLAHGGSAQPSDLVTQGRQALDADKIDEAIAIFEKAVAAAPNDPAALAALGSAQVRKARTAALFDAPGWVKKGFNTLDEAVERFPGAFVVYVTRGITAMQVPEMFRKAPVAVKDLTTVIAMKEKSPQAVPDSVMPSVYLNLGAAYKKNGQIADARAAWEKGKKLYPSAPETREIERELGKLSSSESAPTQARSFPDVLGALKTTPGCLGVDTAQTSSGKSVIFAWFENKTSLVDWYHSDAHQKAMKTVFPDQTFDRRPLPDLAEDSGPILAIVSIKFGDAPRPDATFPQISSIGIELYGPLPGGVAVGGRFAPEALKVRGLREIDLRRKR